MYRYGVGSHLRWNQFFDCMSYYFAERVPCGRTDIVGKLSKRIGTEALPSGSEDGLIAIPRREDACSPPATLLSSHVSSVQDLQAEIFVWSRIHVTSFLRPRLHASVVGRQGKIAFFVKTHAGVIT